MPGQTVDPDLGPPGQRLIMGGQYVHRASEWRHGEIERAAHDPLQLLDRTSP